MNKALSRTLWGVVFVGGLTVLGAGAAHAADTSGEDGAASGNQVGLLADAPVTIVGNAISILGDSEASAPEASPAAPTAPAEAASTTSGHDGILGGNQVIPDVTAPVTAVGNAISVLGDSSSGPAIPADTAEEANSGPATTTGDDGIASGNQVLPDVNAPITVGGNDIAVIRDDGLSDGVGGEVSDELLDGILDGPLQLDPIIGDSVIGDSVIEGPLLGDSVIDGPLLGNVPVLETVLVQPVLAQPVLAQPVLEAPVLAEPAVDGPLLDDVDVSVLSPVETVIVTDGDATGDATDPGTTPLMTTAVMAPAMMLAATGVEALPLLGGILLMLGTGLALMGTKRLTRMLG